MTKSGDKFCGFNIIAYICSSLKKNNNEMRKDKDYLHGIIDYEISSMGYDLTYKISEDGIGFYPFDYCSFTEEQLEDLGYDVKFSWFDDFEALANLIGKADYHITYALARL